MSSSWPDSAATRGARPPAVLLAAAAASPSPAPPASPAGLGPAQQIPVKENGKTVGTARCGCPHRVAAGRGGVPRQVIGLVLAAGAAGALLAAGLGVVFARRATRPVRRSPPPPGPWPPGTGPPAWTPAGPMSSGRWARRSTPWRMPPQAEEELRQGFAAEVAHELRTPLTILRSQVEGLRVGVLDPGPRGADLAG